MTPEDVGRALERPWSGLRVGFGGCGFVVWPGGCDVDEWWVCTELLCVGEISFRLARN